MCGIFGYTGKKNALKTALEGLKSLEYRGYDSAGIALLKDGVIELAKEKGKVTALETAAKELSQDAELAIAHTRWATHGQPSRINAHPHLDQHRSLALVHNGIIENYQTLRKMLQAEGVIFTSETDSEVVAQLIAHFYKNDLLEAIQQVLSLIEGAFSIALIHRDYPNKMFAFAHHAPLAVGISRDEGFISSDARAFSTYTRDVTFLGSNEIAVVQPGKVELYSAELAPISRELKTLASQSHEISKEGYEHFTLKEIFEQPETIQQAIQGRFIEEQGTGFFDTLQMTSSDLLSVQRILILACGTSWHAGYLATYLLEDLARVPTQVEISSEYRYKNPVVVPGTLVIAISQSGETADTIAAVRELKAKGARILAICNTEASTLVREADDTLFLHAGPEIGVCSTKAFTSQVAVLALFALEMARLRHLSKKEGQLFLEALKQIPLQIKQILEKASDIERVAQKYAHFDNFFFLGRRYMYPTAMEGALKLKEISYINANAYAAGEMKHGPIALISEHCPTIAFCANKQTYEKMVSNMMEVRARHGAIVAIAEEATIGLQEIADDIIFIPSTIDELATILASVVAQLFAYYIAKQRGADIDQPRNLAKSVTVE